MANSCYVCTFMCVCCSNPWKRWLRTRNCGPRVESSQDNPRKWPRYTIPHHTLYCLYMAGALLYYCMHNHTVDRLQIFSPHSFVCRVRCMRSGRKRVTRRSAARRRRTTTPSARAVRPPRISLRSPRRRNIVAVVKEGKESSLPEVSNMSVW